MQKNYNRTKNSTGLEEDRNTERMEGKKKVQEAYLKELQALPCKDAEALKAEV